MAEEMKREAYSPSMTVDEYKIAKVNAVKKRTGELISLGFVFDSKQFPSDSASNFNYDVLKNSKSSFIFPKNIATLTGESYSLAEINVDTFWLAAKNFVEPLLNSNRELINSIVLSTTKAELDAIIDNR